MSHEKYDNYLKIINNTSCTTNCLAPLAKVIHDSFESSRDSGSQPMPSLPPKRLWMAPLGSCGVMAKGLPKTSSLLLLALLRTSKTKDDIKKVVKRASKVSFKGFLGYTEDQIVSYNFNSNAHASTFDAGACIALNDHFVKLVSWYDNEFDYIN
ncbi:glyceraldehyde-3-phosphate dehydrogenase-like [Canis lupus familiaris]|uniref:glyceraldehyde-3-phosphate dehydrogenase-like n=1 Tax=Canis lupus familiaris TaxID=9615 RepID=UPI0018F51DF1|nr:glyceraldehyde-3-phosphate dehydrogenase-like [Canis lupus familiaris]